MTSLQNILDFDIEKYLKSKYTNISKSDLTAFSITLFIGFCIHGAALVNFFINEDTQLSGYVDLAVSGRPLFGLLYNLTGNYPFQFLHTAIFIILTSLSGIIIAKSLSTESTILKVLIATLYLSYPAFSIGITYNFGIMGYTCASFFAICAVYFANKEGKFNFFAAVILLTSSLSIYQAYLPVAASLSIAILIKFALNNNIADKTTFVAFTKKAGRFAAFGIFSGISYVCFLKTYLFLTGKALGDYQGADKMGTLDLSPLAFEKIYSCYSNILNGYYFSFPDYFIIPVAVIFFLAMLHIIKQNIIYANAKQTIINLAASIFLSITIFIVAILIPVIAPFAEISFMQTYGAVIVLCTAISMATQTSRSLKSISILASLTIILCFTTKTNAQYYKAALITEASLNTASRIFSRIEETEGFSCNKKLAIIGTLPNAYLQMETAPPFLNERHPGYSGNLVGLSRVNQSHKFTNVLSFLGYKIEPILSAEEYLVASRIALNMPTYPQKGSIFANERIIVVKMNEPQMPLHKKSLGSGKYEFKYTPFDQEDDLVFVWQIFHEGEETKLIQTPTPELLISLNQRGETYCVIAHYKKKTSSTFVHSKPQWLIAD